MRVVRLLLTIGSLLLLALSAGASFAGDNQQWVEVRSPNFSVITDAGEKRGRDVALHFEQMRSVFGTLMAKAHVNLPVPLQIVAFRSSKEMRAMAPIFNGKPTEDAGLFQPGDERSFIMLDMSVENPWSVVFHEYAHQLMNGNMSTHTDPWFEEGFAEYFASIEVDNKQVRVGKIPENTYRILQGEGMMHVAALFRVQQYSKTYNESGSHRTVFYAESSLVVHYLYDNQLIPKLADYYALRIEDKKTVEEATEKAFGMSSERFDKVLRDYLSSGRFKYYAIPTPPNIVAAQFTVAPVSLANAHALLADIDAHSLDHHKQALVEFEDVLRMDPNNADGLRGMGFAYLQQQDYEHAREYFRRAAAVDSKDARVHYYNALLMNRTAGGGAVSGPKTDELKKELETAITLDPKLADAYSLLAYAQATSGEPEKSLMTIKKALELSPRNETYQLNLANMYVANRKPDEAITVLQALSHSANPDVARHASVQLVQVEQFKDQMKSYTARVVSETANGERDPGLGEHGSESVAAAETAGVVGMQSGPPRPVHFIKGKLTAVDCSAVPQAWLRVVAGGRPFKLHVSDTKHVLLLGADDFSCDWKNKSVALNYRERGDGDGDIVSLEIQ